MTDSIKTRQAPERLAALPRRISCWLADSILSGSPLPSSLCRTVALDRLPALSFLGELASRLRLCGMAQAGRVPGGSWQWRLLLVASWIACVESQVKTLINKSEGGESIGNGAPMPDGLARRPALTRILQAPHELRPGAPAGGGQSTVLIAGNRMPLA